MIAVPIVLVVLAIVAESNNNNRRNLILELTFLTHQNKIFKI